MEYRASFGIEKNPASQKSSGRQLGTQWIVVWFYCVRQDESVFAKFCPAKVCHWYGADFS